MTRSIQIRGKVAAATLAASLVLVALTMPGVAGAGVGDSSARATQSAVKTCAQAKKAVKKAKKAVKKADTFRQFKRAQKKLNKAKHRKKSLCSGGAGAAWSDGRYQGTYAENNTDLSFNVVGNRLYTGPFDAFYIAAVCANEDGTDASAIEPVQATIAPNGDFSGSGVYVPGGGEQIAWNLSGHIAGTSITGGTFSVSYIDYYGNLCSGTTHFVAQWYGSYTL